MRFSLDVDVKYQSLLHEPDQITPLPRQNHRHSIQQLVHQKNHAHGHQYRFSQSHNRRQTPRQSPIDNHNQVQQHRHHIS